MIEMYENLEGVGTTGDVFLVDRPADSPDPHYYSGLVLGIVATVGALSVADYPYSSTAVVESDYVDVQQITQGSEETTVYRSAEEASAVEAVRQLLETEARTRGIPATGITVARFSDAEHEIDEIVVTQVVALGADAALVYWDGLTPAIESLIRRLPADQAEIARRGIAVNIEWRPDAV